MTALEIVGLVVMVLSAATLILIFVAWILLALSDGFGWWWWHRG